MHTALHAPAGFLASVADGNIIMAYIRVHRNLPPGVMAVGLMH